MNRPHPETLNEWAALAWRNRKFLLSVCTCGLLAGIVLFFLIRPQYEARMIIAPAIHDYQDALVAREPIVSPARQRSADAVSREFTMFEQTFREVSIARKLAKYLKLLEAVNRDGFFRFTRENIKDAGSLSDYLKREVKIRSLGATSSRLITFRHPDPLFAALLLKTLHEETDAAIREEARNKTEQRVDYLQKQLQRAYNPEHRESLARLLTTEERERMFFNMDASYSTEIIEAPTASLKPVWPNIFIILPAMTLIGLMLGFIILSMTPDKRR